MIRDYLHTILEDAGFTVIAVSDATQAIRILESDGAVDLVFTDIMLPGEIDGFGLVQWLRLRSPDLPIVLTSGGHNAAKAAETCEDKPFISKPYDADALVSCFHHLLGKAKPEAPSNESNA